MPLARLRVTMPAMTKPNDSTVSTAHDHDALRAARRKKLERIIMYAQTALCRWSVLLRYFEPDTTFERCGACDNCQKEEARARLGIDQNNTPAAS